LIPVPKIDFMHPSANTTNIDAFETEEYTILLRIKEFGFLGLIMILGFSGFSICLDKIYDNSNKEKIDQITVHDAITHIDETEPIYR